MLNFDVSSEEEDIIRRIGLRAMNVPFPHKPTLINVLMDVTGCHCNGCPLRLADLLAADDFNFAHDLGGIMAHINRQTGELENFWPRYAMPVTPRNPAAALIKALS